MGMGMQPQMGMQLQMGMPATTMGMSVNSMGMGGMGMQPQMGGMAPMGGMMPQQQQMMQVQTSVPMSVPSAISSGHQSGASTPGGISMEWAVPTQTRARYGQQFQATDRSRTGFLAGVQVMIQTKHILNILLTNLLLLTFLRLIIMMKRIFTMFIF
jgi:hypothetical protein